MVRVWQTNAKAYGADALERWSGYGTLEGLLVRAVCEHAVRLRIGSLNDQLRGVIGELDRAVNRLQQQAHQAAETLENQLVAPLLRLFGYPSRSHPELRQAFVDDDNRDLLSELERRRGGAFQASVQGEFCQFVAQRLDAELGSLRARSLQSAEECVIGAFDRSQNISATEVQKASFDECEVRDRAETVLREGVEFLERSAKLARRDTQLDLRVLSSWDAAGVEGETGARSRHSAWGIRGVGILSSATAAVGTFALANIWNPLGWSAAVAASVMAVATAGSIIFGWLGGKTRKESERRRLVARRQELAKVRKNVHEAYDRFTEAVIDQAQSHALASSKQVLRPPVEQALMHRTVQARCSSLRAELKSLAGDLPRTAEPQDLLWEVATKVERDAYPEHPNAAGMHWLGEHWIDDPSGLKRAHGSTEAGRTRAYDPKIFDRLFGGIKNIFSRIAGDTTPGCGRRVVERPHSNDAQATRTP